MRSVKEAIIGGTICPSGIEVEPLPGFVKSKPMVFAGVYPFDQSEHPALKSSIEKLLLNDSSVECVTESSAALGHGYRLGFLGVLHMEVFTQRLEQEYGTDVVLTAPSVPIKGIEMSFCILLDFKMQALCNALFYISQNIWVQKP